jgi:predicted DCC family thiol-disulfide oxidoreductase YuxK
MKRTKLTVLYDERCAFCRRCRDWLADQPVLVEMELLGAGTLEAQRRYRDVQVSGRELVVVDELGHVWVGPAAFEMCLWATAKHRSLSYRLSQQGWAGGAEAFFTILSKQRGPLGNLFGASECAECDDLERQGAAS